MNRAEMTSAGVVIEVRARIVIGLIVWPITGVIVITDHDWIPVDIPPQMRSCDSSHDVYLLSK